MSAPGACDGLVLLGAIRDALATPQGARLAREIRALLSRADEMAVDDETYSARLVARAFARAEGRLPLRTSQRRGARGNGKNQ